MSRDKGWILRILIILNKLRTNDEPEGGVFLIIVQIYLAKVGALCYNEAIPRKENFYEYFTS